MKIQAVKLGQLNVEMHQSVKTPIGEISAARNVVVKIETDTGLYGWGEASPMAPITGDSQESSYMLGQELAVMMLGRNPLRIEENMTALRRYCGPGGVSILSAFDMALYDIAAKQAGMPLYQFLGGHRRPLQTDHTIGHQADVKSTVAMAEYLVNQGFTTIKLKTGRPGVEDIDHVSAVRKAVGDDVRIRIDCNQGWDCATALNNLNHLEKLGIEYLEQPLPYWDIDGFVRLRQATRIPICADESVFNHVDALRLIQAGAVDYLNIKLVKSGGINTALKINAIAEAANARCMIGCFGESRLGLTAAAHVAMARPNIQFIDLDSALHFCFDPVKGGMRYLENTGGKIDLSDHVGLGAELDEYEVDKLTVFE